MYTVELELISTTVSQSTLEARSSSLSPSLTLSPCPVLYTRQDVTNSFVGPIRTGPQVRDNMSMNSTIYIHHLTNSPSYLIIHIDRMALPVSIIKKGFMAFI